MALQVGNIVFLDYGERPRTVHARLILAEVIQATHEFMILTPDFDVYTEILDQSNPDLSGFYLSGPGGGMLVGVPPRAMLGLWLMAELKRQLSWLAGAGPVVVAAPAAAPPVVAPPVVGAQTMWVLAEMVEGHLIGEEVQPPPSIPTLGEFGLATMTDQAGVSRVVLVKNIQVEDLASFCEERIQLARSSEAVAGEDTAAADDLRTRSIKYLANGDRRRLFSESVGEMSSVEMEDFPYAPRTCSEYLQAISAVAESAFSQHLAWVQQSKIPEGSRAIYEDQVLAQILDTAISFDCLQVSNLASFELLVRRRQLLAEAHSYDPTSPNFQGADYWLGSRYKHGNAIVINSLTEHVAKRLQADSQILKEKRKLEEAKGKGKSTKQAPKAKAGGAAGSGSQ